VGFLEDLDVDARAAVREAALVRRYPRGSLLFAEGDPGHEVLIITDGAVKVVVTAESGREVVLDVLEGGELLGETAAIDGGPRSATAFALTQVEVLAVPQARFRELVDEYPRLAGELLQMFASRMRGAARRQLEFGTNDALGRVCQRLVDLAERYGTTGEGGRVVVDAPVTQSELAAWSGLSREAVVKGLRALRRLGWIEVDGRRLVVLDPAAVSERART
jgi:CRP-like cAMP-binding protein